MRIVMLLALLIGSCALAGILSAQPPATPAPQGMQQVHLGSHTFTLPVGFTIELVAGPPLVDRPIVADFDERGRLYVADSSGTNDRVETQLAKKPHRIVRLVDTKGDGRFDKQTIYADSMMFPEGAMFRDGSLYVAAPPSIWKLTDTQDKGVADQRVEWFKGKTLTGCANDLHGPYQGPDGWIYWCKGAFAKQTYERTGKTPFVTNAAHIFRARPDGTGIEPVMTGGMDNPVEVVFTPGGERIFTTTFLQTPGGGRRDGLIHAIYGGVYGKDQAAIYAHPWTGPSTMPVLVHFGPAAPAGLVRYESKVFGPEYQDNLFAALFNMQKVTRHVLIPEGATFRTQDQDFLVSDNKDFHPTDVLEDADGSLLVIDTGGWYKLCCPSSQLHKPDILGGIYRIRRVGAPVVADPRGLQVAWDKATPAELAAFLGDARPAVARRAIATLAAKGAAALPALAETLGTSSSALVRRNAVWAACRIEGGAARSVARQVLGDADETVRQVAIHAASVHRDRDALSVLANLLEQGTPHNQRAAAEALGRLGDASIVPALMTACGKPADRTLEHSRIFALIEIGDRAQVEPGLKSDNARIRQAAIVALDQMGAGPLDAVMAELTSKDARLKETAWWIAIRHPEWGTALTGILKERLSGSLTPAEREELADQLARFSRSSSVQEFLGQRLADAQAPKELRLVVLRAMARSGRDLSNSWQLGLNRVLQGDQPELIGEAVLTARALNIAKNPGKLPATLLHVAQQSNLPTAVRLNALAAIPAGVREVSPDLMNLLLEHLTPEYPVSARSAAVEVLTKAQLTSPQLLALAQALKKVGPLELDRLVDAFARSSDEAIGQALVKALQTAPARTSLRADTLKPRLAKFGPTVASAAQELYTSLEQDFAEQKAQLESIVTSLSSGDVRRGQLVFNSARAACISCHEIGYVGGHVGPDLTRIGKIRTERDLLESIIFPSASFVRSYEPVVATTKSGKIYNGLVRRDTPEELVLTLSGTEEVRLARDTIEDVQPSKVSIMPAGLDKQLSKQELADLVAFLKAAQ
ncbi:MAG TPA: PVC-type heme-binding CxxCH protein [Gemmataceae bacterium]|nr:PVC-type heme-binding CxxCH protein [Gemmataceae bacterium]